MKKGKKNQRKYMFMIMPVVAVAVGIGALAFSQGESKQNDVISSSELMLGGSPILGDPNASVTVVEWGDYQDRKSVV